MGPEMLYFQQAPRRIPWRRSLLSVSGLHADPAPGHLSTSGQQPWQDSLCRPQALSPSSLSARPRGPDASLVLRVLSGFPLGVG